MRIGIIGLGDIAQKAIYLFLSEKKEIELCPLYTQIRRI